MKILMNPLTAYRAIDIPRLIGVAAAYLLISQATAQYFAAVGIFTAIIRPGAGFALGVLLLAGRRYWPAIFIGSLISNVVQHYSLFDSFLLAGGVSLSAALGAWLLKRRGWFDLTIPAFRDFARLVFWGGFIGSSVSAVTGAIALFHATPAGSDAFASTLVHWWMGSALGVLVVAPLLLIWKVPPRNWLKKETLAKVSLYFLTAFLAGQAIFLGWFALLLGKVALGYWMFLFVVWGAAQFGPHSVVILLVMTTVQALMGAFLGVGFFGADIAKTGLLNFWFYLFALSTVGMGLASRVTAFKRVEQAVRDLAHHDPLTGLPNRLLLTDRIDQAISNAKREKNRVAIIFHDLDHFKPVNDDFGHRIGDLLLQEVAVRVKDSIRESDTVGRIGGDEFVIVLPAIVDIEDAMQVALKIHDALLRSFNIEGRVINISTSIGMALYPEHGGDETSLTVNADNAMYFAKQKGRNNIQVFAPEMSATDATRR